MSGLASSAPNPGRNKPCGYSAGPVNHAVAGPGDPDAEVGAVAAHRGDQGRAGNAGRGVADQLAGGHHQVQEEVVVAGDEPVPPRQCRTAGRSEAINAGRISRRNISGAGAVAVVPLVAHLHHLADDRGDVDRPGGAHRRGERGAEHVGHPAQPGDHLGAVGAVAQHLAQALVQRAPGARTGRRIGQLEQPHRRRDHPGHRTDRVPLVTRGRARYPVRFRVSRRPRPRRRRGPRRSTRRSARRAAVRDARANSIGGPAWQNSPGCRPSASRAGRTSTSSARVSSIRCAASSFAAARRGSARTAASASSTAGASEPGRSGGRKSTVMTSTACARNASASRSMPTRDHRRRLRASRSTAATRGAADGDRRAPRPTSQTGRRPGGRRPDRRGNRWPGRDLPGGPGRGSSGRPGRGRVRREHLRARAGQLQLPGSPGPAGRRPCRRATPRP